MGTDRQICPSSGIQEKKMNLTSAKEMLRMAMFISAVLIAVTLNCTATFAQVAPGLAAMQKPIKVPPKPLQPAEKMQLVKKVLASKGQNVTSLTGTIPLGLGSSTVASKADLIFWTPQIVASFYARFAGTMGFVQLFFFPPAAGNYVLDATVDSTDPAARIQLAGPGINSILNVGAANQQKHLLFIFEAQQANQKMELDLKAVTKSEWTFFSGEISQIK